MLFAQVLFVVGFGEALALHDAEQRAGHGREVTAGSARAQRGDEIPEHLRDRFAAARRVRFGLCDERIIQAQGQLGVRDV
jgi:hypothetical protein